MELTNKLRRPAKNKATPEKYSKLDPASKKLIQNTDGHPTMAAVYRELFPEIRRIRKWSAATAKGYDSVMAKKILPLFGDKAFEDLYEDDFLDIWGKMKESHLPDSNITIASVVIRALMDLAYEKGLTKTILWGLPEYQSESSKAGKARICNDKNADEGESMGAQMAADFQKLKSVSPTVELAIAQGMIDHLSEDGELVAGLIMLLTGARTSEATGFSYEHLVEMCSGQYVLVRYEVSKDSSSETIAGGKTDNAYRFLPIPHFFAEILLNRKEMIANQYPDSKIEDFPLSCIGKRYEVRCIQKELNERMKGIYRDAGVAEEMMAATYHHLETHPEIRDDCEGTATAYLCRHIFATSLVYCGLSQAEIYAVMGHKMETEVVKKADFANPDKYLELVRKLNRRPLIQALDKLPDTDIISYDGSISCFEDGGKAEIHFDIDKKFQIDVLSVVSGDQPEIQCENVDDLEVIPIAIPYTDTKETLCIRNQLHEIAQLALNGVSRKISDAMDDLNEDNTSEDNIHICPQRSDQARTYQPNDRKPVVGPHIGGKQLRSKKQFVAIPDGLYVLTDSTDPLRLPSQWPLQSRAKVGEKWDQLHGCHVVGGLQWQQKRPGLVILPDATAYKFSMDENAEAEKIEMGDHPVFSTNANKGIVLQDDSLFQNSAAVIVILLNTGRIRSIQVAALKQLSRDKNRIIYDLSADETVVSACVCQDGDDIIVFSKKGRALLLSGASLRATKSIPVSAYSGMKLLGNDEALACRPYKKGDEYIFITDAGQAVCTAKDFSVLSHRRGSQGIPVAKKIEQERIVNVCTSKGVLMAVYDDGKIACINDTEIRRTKGGGSGVAAFKCRRGHHIVAAFSFKLQLEKAPDQTAK